MTGMILSVDIGTSSLKAAFIDADGRLLAFSRAAYRPDSKGIVSAGAWEAAFIETLKDLSARVPGRAPDGICVSGNGPTLVPLARNGEALPPLYWHGGRAMSPGEKEAPSFFLPLAAWFKNRAPDEYKKTGLFVSSHEWLASKLGAETVTALPSPSYEPYYWNDEQCRLYRLDREKFPPFVKTGEAAGRVSAGAASFLASCSAGCIKEGTPVIAGGPDFITALIGTGTLKPGLVCDRAGSSEGVNFCASEPPGQNFPASGGVRVLPHAKEGFWNVGVVIPSSGRLFDLYRSFTGQEGRNYGELLAELIPASGGAEIFGKDFFFFSGGEGSGSFESAVSRSGLSGDKIALGRAVLCAIGFSVRSAIKTLALRGFPLGGMRVSGGQGKNPRWNQLKADITGAALMIPEIPDGELAGNAVLAVSALEKTGMEETAARMIRFREVYKPRPASASFWEERFRLYGRET